MQQHDKMKLAKLDRAIQRGLADVKDDRVILAKHVFARLDEKYQTKVKDSSA